MTCSRSPCRERSLTERVLPSSAWSKYEREPAGSLCAQARAGWDLPIASRPALRPGKRRCSPSRCWDWPKIVNTDILVIGDGLAGSAAAIEAARMGASVALVSAAHGSSDRAQGGIAAATLPEDSPRLHDIDTLAAGGDLCDPSAVAMLTSAGPETVRWLESLGVRFDGGAAREAAHSLPRVLHLGGDQSGRTLMAFVHAAIELEPRITRFSAKLHALLGDGVCEGAAFSGGLNVFAGATILATGGYA